MATPAVKLPFTKYHGLGNDFVLLDCRDMPEPPLTPAQAASMCDRNFGVGADGVIFVLPSDTEDSRVRMRIYNSDGSEPEMCGNGIRCMAKYFSAELESLAVGESDQYTISTLAGPIVPRSSPTARSRWTWASPSSRASSCRRRFPPRTTGASSWRR